MTKFHRDLVETLRSMGATAIEVFNGGKHPRIRGEIGGKRFNVTVSASPSCQHAKQNVIPKGVTAGRDRQQIS